MLKVYYLTIDILLFFLQKWYHQVPTNAKYHFIQLLQSHFKEIKTNTSKKGRIYQFQFKPKSVPNPGRKSRQSAPKKNIFYLGIKHDLQTLVNNILSNVDVPRSFSDYPTYLSIICLRIKETLTTILKDLSKPEEVKMVRSPFHANLISPIIPTCCSVSTQTSTSASAPLKKRVLASSKVSSQPTLHDKWLRSIQHWAPLKTFPKKHIGIQIQPQRCHVSVSTEPFESLVDRVRDIISRILLNHAFDDV